MPVWGGKKEAGGADAKGGTGEGSGARKEDDDPVTSAKAWAAELLASGKRNVADVSEAHARLIGTEIGQSIERGLQKHGSELRDGIAIAGFCISVGIVAGAIVLRSGRLSTAAHLAARANAGAAARESVPGSSAR
eukprot:tig00021525_g22124.t1